jgi:hypothetical protein
MIPRLRSLRAERASSIYNAAIYVLILTLSCLASLALRKDRNWDLLNYHFYDPYMFLTGRLGFDFFPAQIPNYLNPLMDIPTYFMITSFKPWVVGAIMGIWHGLNLILAYRITRRIFQFLSPFMVALLATSVTILSANGSIIWGLWGTFMGDLTISIYVLASLNLLLSAWNTPSGKARTRQIIWAGLLLGLGTGLKATSAAYAIPLIMLTLFFGNSFIERLRTLIVFALACLVGFLLTYGYWAWILQSQYGNPFFPFYNAIFRSPLIAPVSLSDFLHWMPKTFLSSIRLPFTFFLNGGGLEQAEVPCRAWRPGIAFLGLLLLAIVLLWRLIRRRWVGRLFPPHAIPMIILILFFLFSWAIWQLEFAYFRYTAPIEFIIPLVVLAAAYLIIPRVHALVGAVVVMFILLIPTTQPLDYGRSPWTDDYFEINIPAALHLEDSQVLIADVDRPLAYFVPFFPASTQVLRITSNMDGLLYTTSKTLLISQIEDQLHKPLKKFVMYVEDSTTDPQSRINQVLAYYALQIQPGICSRITSIVLVATLCPVDRSPGNP